MAAMGAASAQGACTRLRRDVRCASKRQLSSSPALVGARAARRCGHRARAGVVRRWPTVGMAQAGMALPKPLEDFYFRACTLDCQNGQRCAQPLVELMLELHPQECMFKGPERPPLSRSGDRGRALLRLCATISDRWRFTCPRARPPVEGEVRLSTDR